MSHGNVYAPEILPVRSQMLLAAKISALGFHAHREVWVLLLPHVNGWVLFRGRIRQGELPALR